MTRLFIFFGIFLLSLSIMGFSSFSWAAQEEKPLISAKEDIERVKSEKAIEDHKARISKLLASISKDLDKKRQQHFYLTYNNYNLIKTVKIVQEDVSDAVDACSEKNSDMEAKMRRRFATWNTAIGPIIEEAEGNLNNMILAQDYAPSEDINALFEEIDKSRTSINNQIQKIPVTTPEACQYLHDKMDETQENMVKLLRRTLVTFPQNFPNSQDIE